LEVIWHHLTVILDFEKIEGDTESRLSQITLWVTEATEANLDFLVKLTDF